MVRKNDGKFIVSGALAGLANGFFGAGGGMFLVPLFCRWIKLSDREALATSLAVIFPVSIVSAVVYFINNGIDVFGALPFLIGGLFGGILGGKLFKKISPVILRRTLALFIIYGGIRSLFAI
ncbi:MAG: sulfite exporter TauE/SafE family protein [Oscillospiraceae bacterium]|nr:sulfite exporter TauE/SafE family protein [Oscillospiraceae bacterium]